MPLPLPDERISLNYPDATFRHSLNCLCVALVTFGAIWLPGPTLGETSGGPSLNVIGLGIIIVFSLIMGIQDALFVVDQKFLVRPITFDDGNVYICSALSGCISGAVHRRVVDWPPYSS